MYNLTIRVCTYYFGVNFFTQHVIYDHQHILIITFRYLKIKAKAICWIWINIINNIFSIVKSYGIYDRISRFFVVIRLL